MSDDERPRKSWRDIDKQKDRSQHRREERPPLERKTGPGSQKSYRAALDRLFSTGKIAELVESKAPGTTKTTEDSENRLKMLARIKSATDRETIIREVDALLEKYELPDDLEVLERVLAHRRPELQLQAMQRIDRLLDQGPPKRRRALLGQLKLIRELGPDDEILELCRKLIARLE